MMLGGFADEGGEGGREEGSRWMVGVPSKAR